MSPHYVHIFSETVHGPIGKRNGYCRFCFGMLECNLQIFQGIFAVIEVRLKTQEAVTRTMQAIGN